MAIIYSYQENEELRNSDRLVGTATTIHNGKVRKVTKNFSLGDLKTFINTGDLILSNGGTSGPATLIDNVLNIPVYQGQITLTTTGSSGAATLIGNTLNIPQYGGTPPTPTLQQVTTAGNTTSNSIIVSNGAGSLVTISNNGIFFNTSTSHGVIFSNSGFSLVDDLTTQQFSLDFDGLYLKTISGGSGGRIKADLLTSTQRAYQLPDASGTFALTSDIPSAITLTTTGSSGSSTLISGVLNVPTYTLSGLGGVPTSRTLTINGTAYDLTADRSWSVGTVTSVTATGQITSTGGTTPVISTLMHTDRLIGRTTAGTGVMEEITVGSGLALSGGTLSSSALSGSILHGIAAGTDTYTVTITGATAYADGDAYLINFTNGNTTSATLNINGQGAIALWRNNDGPLIGGDIVSGGEILCVYRAATNVFQCIGTAPNTLLAYVTNAETSTITKGQAVYVSGGTGDRIKVKLASNVTDATSAQTIGIVQSTSIAANQKGLIIVQGQLDNLSLFPTATWADGDFIYLGATPGTLTNVKPFAPNHLVYLGYVTTASNGSAGRMYVKVQNGYEMNEIHDVYINPATLANGDLLQYNSSTDLWLNKSLSAAGIQPTLTNPVTGTGTTNYVSKFTGTTTLGNSLIYDNGTNLGIGTAVPGNKLQIGASDSSNQLLRLGVSYNTARALRGGINWHDGTNTTGQISTEYDGSIMSMVFGSLYSSGYNSNPIMTIRGNGLVGIGTISPTVALQVGDTTSGTGNYIKVLGNNTDSTYDVFRGERRYPRFTLKDTVSGGSEFNFWNLGNQMRFGTDTGSIETAAFAVFSGANGNSQFGGNFAFTNNASKTISINNTLTDVVGRNLTISAGSTVAGTAAPNLAGGSLTLRSGLGTGTGDSTIQFQTGTTLTSGLTLQTMSTKMTILGNGNVGIGTTAPTARLHVAAPGALSTDIALRVRNSADSLNLMFVNGLGQTAIGQGTATLTNMLTVQDVYSTSVGIELRSDQNPRVGSTFNTSRILSGYSSGTASFLDLQYAGGAYPYTYTTGLRLNSLGNILINTTTDLPSSKLTIESTTQGVLFPRMTTTQKNAIATPATGLVVFDTTLNKLCVRGASAWETITSI